MHVYEEHGEVLAFWAQDFLAQDVEAMDLPASDRGRTRTVLCFDRHLDIKAIAASALQSLRQAAQNGDTLAALRRDVPFRDDGKAAFGSDDFLYAAAQLGFLMRLIWVVPEPRPLSPNALAAQLWEALSLVYGHGHEILETFTVDQKGAACEFAGVSLEITTLRQLDMRSLGETTALDIDLDYFATPEGVIEQPLEDFATTMSKLGLLDEPATLSLSIAAGFLPERFRDVAKDLAALCGQSFEWHGSRPSGAALSMGAVAQGRALDACEITDLWERELQHLGGAGYAALCVLKARSGDLTGAQRCYDQARAHGDRARWAAYTLGTIAMHAGAYQQAVVWLNACDPDAVDSMCAHALILRAICHMRLGEPHHALAIAERGLHDLPMRIEISAVGALAARALGETQRAVRFEAHRDRLKAFRSLWSA